MAIQINKQLNTVDGFAVQPGTHMKFITEFKMDGNTAEVALRPFVNLAAYQAGNSHFQCKELRTIGNILIDLTTLTQQEQELLEQVSDIIHAKVIQAIAEAEADKAAQVAAEIEAEAERAEVDENYTPRVIEPYDPITANDMQIV